MSSSLTARRLLLTTQYLEEADELADQIIVIDHGTVIAAGTSSELKKAIGGARLAVTLSAPHPGAEAALRPYVEGRDPSGPGRSSARGGCSSASGLATTVVRALDAAGVLVDDVEVRQPSLDDVFFSLTGHPASDLPNESEADAALTTGALL